MLTVMFAISGLVGVDAHAQQCSPETPPTVEPPNDRMSDTRLLRRIVLGLTGTTPTLEQYEAMAAAATPEAREALLRSTLVYSISMARRALGTRSSVGRVSSTCCTHPV